MLSLSDNKIGGKLNDLINTLKEFEELKKLDLAGNPVCNEDKDKYRQILFQGIPSLEIIDGYDKDGNLIPESEDDYDEEGEENFDDYGSDAE
jgi:hypothetical protein